MKVKHWYDYLWVYAIIYFALGFFNILFAWLGMIDFLLPLFLAIFGGNKFFCNHLCGRGQLFSNMVCVLPDGNHDVGYLQAEKQKIIKDNRKEPFS